MKKSTIDYPLPFSQSVSSSLRIYSELKKLNLNTHRWINDGDTMICMSCDCRYGSHPSEWPCGYPVPRSSDIL